MRCLHLEYSFKILSRQKNFFHNKIFSQSPFYRKHSKQKHVSASLYMCNSKADGIFKRLNNSLDFSKRQFHTKHLVKYLEEVSLVDEGKKIDIQWSDGRNSQFHSIWLRHNCQCTQCIQEGSGQRVFDGLQVSHDVKIENIEDIDSALRISWGGKYPHQGEVTHEYLHSNSYSPDFIHQRYSDVKITELAKDLPVVTYQDVMSNDKDLYRWLQFINEYGLCLMKDVPTEDEIVLNIASKIGPIQETNYGKSFDVKSSPNPINVAYSTVGLELHMDLVYLESPPGLQLLHCMRYDECLEGGESTYLDVFHVVEEFRQTNKEHFDVLTKIPATFYKCHYDRENPFHLVYQKPHIILNHREEVVAVNWAPPFEGPLLVEEKDVMQYYRAYEELNKAIQNSGHSLTYQMQVGDLMTFNNHRMLHGRKEFKLNGGIRHLQGCYVCIDDFKCKVQVLSNLIGDGRPPKHVCNQSWL